MIKAVIFDCFGVLTTEAWLAFKTRYFAHNPESFKQASNVRQQADQGLISYGDFMKAIAELAGITPNDAARAIERNVPNEELFIYIQELKADYKLGLLSNVAGDYLRHIFTKDQLALFDAIVLSYQNGFIKPQPEAFANAAKELGARANECVFIDDQQRNIDGARATGMYALRYHDLPTLKQELNEILKKF